MTAYRLTAAAKSDLRAIWSFIAIHNLSAAEKVESAIYDACTMLAQNPLCGHVRPDLTKAPLRFWTLPRYRSYVIVYDPSSHPLRVIRVFHGAQNVGRELKGVN